MDELKKELLEKVREGCGYDFIANHYYEFTKEELKDIILECLYVIDDNKAMDVAEELEDFRWQHLL